MEDMMAPKNWRIIHRLLEEYRAVNPAPVDTMGCERLSSEQATPESRRFQTLVALMLSSQTKDQVTSQAMTNLFEAMPDGFDAQTLLTLSENVLMNCINKVGFHKKKSIYLKKAAEICLDKYKGDIPKTVDELMEIPGVGPKMAYLTMQTAWNQTLGIGVDTHVHRISNRLKWVKNTKDPESTRKSLESWLPKEHWKSLNVLLVGFGQTVCLPLGPKCDSCPLSEYCPSSTGTGKGMDRKRKRK